MLLGKLLIRIGTQSIVPSVATSYAHSHTVFFNVELMIFCFSVHVPMEKLLTLSDILLTDSMYGDDVGNSTSNVTDPCDADLKATADYGGKLTKCLIGNARPFRMCENCIEDYTRFTRLYEDLMVSVC